jgi:hypothetical protein
MLKIGVEDGDREMARALFLYEPECLHQGKVRQVRKGPGRDFRDTPVMQRACRVPEQV